MIFARTSQALSSEFISTIYQPLPVRNLKTALSGVNGYRRNLGLDEKFAKDPMKELRKHGKKLSELTALALYWKINSKKNLCVSTKQIATYLKQDRRSACRVIKVAIEKKILIQIPNSGRKSVYILNDQLDIKQLYPLLQLVNPDLEIFKTLAAPHYISRSIYTRESLGIEECLEAHDERTEYPKKGGNLFPSPAEGRRSLPEAALFCDYKKNWRRSRNFSIDIAMPNWQSEKEQVIRDCQAPRPIVPDNDWELQWKKIKRRARANDLRKAARMEGATPLEYLDKGVTMRQDIKNVYAKAFKIVPEDRNGTTGIS